MNENKSKSKTTNMHDHTYKLRILLIDDADNCIGNPT